MDRLAVVEVWWINIAPVADFDLCFALKFKSQVSLISGLVDVQHTNLVLSKV